MPSHQERRAAGFRPITEAQFSSCPRCGRVFYARTLEAAESMVESHFARASCVPQKTSRENRHLGARCA